MEHPATISFSAELQRKAIHLLALVVPAGILYLGRIPALYALGTLMVVAIAADVARARSRAFDRFIRSIFGFMMRAEELTPVGGPIALNGATWVLISSFLTTLFFPARIAAVAISVFMLADAAAAVFGRRFGRTRWGPHGRTLEGTAAFIVVGLAVVSVAPGIAFLPGAAGVLVGSIAEAVPRPLNDNLRVPLTIGLVVFVLERLLLPGA